MDTGAERMLQEIFKNDGLEDILKGKSGDYEVWVHDGGSPTIISPQATLVSAKEIARNIIISANGKNIAATVFKKVGSASLVAVLTLTTTAGVDQFDYLPNVFPLD